MARRLFAVLTLALALTLTACAVDPGSVVGRWGAAIDEDGGYVDIIGGGQMTGHDGCNGFGGRWSETDSGQAQFEDVFMTLVACPGIAYDDQWLSLARTAEVRNGRLVLFDESGDVLGTLSRAG